MAVFSMASYLVVLFIGLYILHALSYCGRAQDFSTELIHTESPHYDPTATPSSRSGVAMTNYSRDANSNNSRLLGAPDSNSIYLDGFAHNGRLALKLVLGTPNQIAYVIVSTTDPFSWVMCHPCETCEKFAAGFFNPSVSTTYETVPCESNSCESIRRVPCTDSRDNCTYEQPYIKGLHARGLLSQETLHLQRGIYDDEVIVQKVLFGCTHKIIGRKPKDKTHKIIGRKHKYEILPTGIIGLNDDKLSLINQLFYNNKIPRKFSFCIPLEEGLSRIYFGNTPPADSTITTARLFIDQYSGLYSVHLMMIEVSFPRPVDTSPLQIAVEQEKAPPLSRIHGNMIIDSETQGTFIDDEKMEILTTKILNRFPRARVDVPKNLRNILDLCFDWSEPNVNVLPVISFFFSDNGIIYGSEAFVDLGDDVLCLLIASTNHSKGVQKLGSGVMRGIRFEMDLEEKVVKMDESHKGDCWDR